MEPIHNIFQRGLKRGAERLPYDPEKRYFYVEHPTEGWRVYLRACSFIHEKPERIRASQLSNAVGRLDNEKQQLSEENASIDPMRFIVVKRRGRPANGKEWEPPKGQMEGKDGLRDPKDSIMDILRENVKREVAEESRIKQLQGLRFTGLVFQGREKDYPPNHFFQYVIFHAQVTTKEWMRAAAELDWYRAHPIAFERLRRDKKEKDALAWYSPSDTKIMGRWSPTLVAMYLKKYAQ
jgi:ADP-ribose pyrophosphatase YjhB (NUDIX family)